MEAQPYEPPPFMLSGDVSHAFQQRGWVRGAGGHLYFNGLRTTAHPHLHLIINGQNTVRQGTDIKQSIRMLAWSDGQQGAGGGGGTYLRVNAANIWEMGTLGPQLATKPTACRLAGCPGGIQMGDGLLYDRLIAPGDRSPRHLHHEES